MKILFICSANKQRSKTAEDYFSERYSQHQFLSAGTNFKICFLEATQPVTDELLCWAEIIYVMEKHHKDFVLQSFGDIHKTKIKILHIQDKFKYYQKELLFMLNEKVLI